MKIQLLNVFLLKMFFLLLLQAPSAKAEEPTMQTIWQVERSEVIDWYLQDPKPIIVVDLDDTVVESTIINNVLLFIGFFYANIVEPIPFSAETIEELSASYNIIYVTARPSQLARNTMTWLDGTNFVRAPVFFSETFLVTHNVRVAYKSAVLDHLQNTIGFDLKFGIGDKASDMVAYSKAGMTPFLILSDQYDNDFNDSISFLEVEGFPETTPSFGEIIFSQLRAWPSIANRIQASS